MKAVRRMPPAAAPQASAHRPTHRHTLGHEHEFEPQRGLPEVLPSDEKLLWQGSPDWRQLAREAFHIRGIAWYFAAMLALRGAFRLGDGASALDALVAVLWLAPLPLIALGVIALMARLSAQGAVYTITDRRVVMRIGIVLTVTFNLPYRRLQGASLHRQSGGHGDIALALPRADRIAWLHLWPHVRAWRLTHPEPLLRCVPEAEHVAQVLARAWSQATGEQTLLTHGSSSAGPASSPAGFRPSQAQPAPAGD